MWRRQRTVLFALLLAAGCGGGDDGSADGAPGTDGPPAIDAAPPADADTRYLLSQTGLGDPGVIEYAPSYFLWSDGAEKRRWIWLPPGTQIDTSDMNHWVFPVGTKLWKEFSLGGVALETRLIERVGASGDDMADYWMGSFIWLPDHSDAVFEPLGAEDVLGTNHDVPNATQCWTCHMGDVGHVLGFSAAQLPTATRDALAAANLLSNPPPAGEELGPPGDALTRDALGWLHANCGHCHNPLGAAWSDTQQNLRLDVEDRDPTMTTTWLTTVNQPLQYWSDSMITLRIKPGDPDLSAIAYRISVRGNLDQMPPMFSTEYVDMDGLAAVRAWIASMPP